MGQPLDIQLTEAQYQLLTSLDSPFAVQAYLDTTLYRPEYSNFCPLKVLQEGQAHCLDGAIFAAAALRRLGHPPLLVDMFPDPGMDDDHVLAIFKRNGRYGAVAKSNFVGLRFREPVYVTLRELVMSYFEQFYNINGVKTLRTYTMPVNLARFDALKWETTEEGVNAIEKALLARRRFPLLPAGAENALFPVDPLTYKAGMLVANMDGVYRPKENE